MKRYGKYLRKAEAFALALSMIATMAQPVSSYAADVTDVGNAGNVMEAAGNQGDAAESDFSGTDAEEGETGDKAPDEGMVVPDGVEDGGEEKEELPNPEPDEGISGQPDSSDTGTDSSGSGEDQTEETNPSDNDKVIHVEKLLFSENEKTVDQTVSPSLNVTTKEVISDECLYACFQGEKSEEIVPMPKVENTTESGTCYEGIFTIGRSNMDGRWNLKEIYAEREGEKIRLELENTETYWFQIRYSLGTEEIHVNEIQFSDNGGTVNQTSRPKMSVALDEIILDERAYACFVHENGESTRLLPMSRISRLSETGTYYEGDYSFSLDDAEGIWRLKEIYVERNENKIKFQLENAEEYWFEIKLLLGPDAIHINQYQFYQNGWIVDQTIRPMMNISTAETILDKYVHARFVHESGGAEKILSMNRWQCGNLDESGTKFGGCFSIDQDTQEGIWRLQEIYVERGGKQINLELGDEKESWFRVKLSPENDTEKPEIQSVTLEHNGEVVGAGQSVSLTVEASDNGTLKQGTAWFRSASTLEYRQVGMRYDALEEGIYRGTFEITEDMGEGEWYLASLDIRDSAGNAADASAFTDGTYYPYYVNVSNEAEYTDPVYDIYVWFYALDENGEWEIIDEVKRDGVKRRTPLRELGITFPEVTTQYADFNQTGWMDYAGRMVTEDALVTGNVNWAIYANYDKLRVRYLYYHYSEDGRTWTFDSVNETYPAGTTYGEVRENARNAAPPEECPAGLNFKEWSVGIVDGADDETIAGSHYDQYATATYDKALAGITYSYFNEAGEWCDVHHSEVVEKGTTYRTLLEVAGKYEPKDLSDGYEFERWECSRNLDAYLDQTIEDEGGIWLKAKYSNQLVVPVEWTYFDKDGYQIPENTALLVDEGTTVEEVKAILNEKEMPEMYPGLEFEEWDISVCDEVDEVIRNGQQVLAKAVYDKYLVRYIIDPTYEAAEDTYAWEIERNKRGIVSIFCQIVEKGGRVTVPESFEGFGDVTWLIRNMGKDNFAVEEDKTFIGYGKKAENEETKPDDPTVDDGKSEIENIPVIPPLGGGEVILPDFPPLIEEAKPIEKEPIKLPEDRIDITVDKIQEVEISGAVDVDMGEATVVPPEFLGAAMGKDIDIRLEMGKDVSTLHKKGEYTWTINGMYIFEIKTEMIDLRVKMDEDAIPTPVVEELAGNNPIRQISLQHDGPFGFDASLTMYVGSEYAGQYGNLFYYRDGKMEFMNADQVADNGEVSFGFSHASDYVVVMSDEKMSQSSVPESLQPEDGDTDSDKDDTDKDNTDKDNIGAGGADKGDADTDNTDKNGANTDDTDKGDAGTGDPGNADKDNTDKGNAGTGDSGKQDTDKNTAGKEDAESIGLNKGNGSDTNSTDKTDGDADAAGRRRSAKTGDGNEVMPLILCCILAFGVSVSIRRKRTS